MPESRMLAKGERRISLGKGMKVNTGEGLGQLIRQFSLTRAPTQPGRAKHAARYLAGLRPGQRVADATRGGPLALDGPGLGVDVWRGAQYYCVCEVLHSTWMMGGTQQDVLTTTTIEEEVEDGMTSTTSHPVALTSHL